MYFLFYDFLFFTTCASEADDEDIHKMYECLAEVCSFSKFSNSLIFISPKIISKTRFSVNFRDNRC